MLRVALWAQRQAHRIPTPVRRVASRVLATVGRRGPVSRGPIEDWTVPLIAGRTAEDMEAVTSPPPPAPPRTAAIPTGTERPLRCVVAIDVLDVGGMDEFAAFLGRRLPSVGVAAVVAYAGTHMAGQQGEGGRLVRALERDGVPIVKLSANSAVDWLRSQHADVISAHGAPDWLLGVATALGVPWVETLHGMHHFLHPDTWPAERRRATQISGLIAVSELVRRQYLARIPNFPADRIVTVPNGIDEQRIRPIDGERARDALGLRDEFMFLSLARYVLQKNTFALVSAFAEVAAAHPEAHLVVAGRADDPLYYEQVRALAETLPCADRIHLRGHCPNPPALLAAADAFVLNSFFEGWALASMEALAFGVPVVMSDVGGAREQLGDGTERGHLIANPAGDAESVDWPEISNLRFRPQGNRDELVAAMSSIVRDRERWVANKQRLRDQSRAAFPAEACLQGHAAVLRSVAGRVASAA